MLEVNGYFGSSAFPEGPRQEKAHYFSALKSEPSIPSFHPRTIVETAERFLRVKDMVATGELHDEAQRMGISPAWIARMHEENPYVAISEQLMPLPTLFGKLGKYGSPEAMRNAILHVGDIAREISLYSNRPVKTGLLASPNHAASGSHITSGFYILLPNFNFFSSADKKNRNDSKMVKIRLIPNRMLSKLDGMAYRDLLLQVSTLEAIGASLQTETTAAQQRHTNSETKHLRQVSFNERGQENNRPVDREMYLRERSYLRAAKRDEMHLSSLKKLSEIWNRCVDEATAGITRPITVSYWNFVSSFNRELTAKMVPQMPFENISPAGIDNLATLGVENWRTFIGAFTRNHLIERDEPILRRRGPSGKQETLIIHNSEGTEVANRAGEVFRIDDLVAQSRESLALTGAPTLYPIAMIRYWTMFMLGNGIALEDGMSYVAYRKLFQASIEGDLTDHPRGALVSPYTGLNSYIPKDPLDPYADLSEEYDILRFIRLLND